MMLGFWVLACSVCSSTFSGQAQRMVGYRVRVLGTINYSGFCVFCTV